MSLVKIYSSASSKQVMFIDNELSRWKRVQEIFIAKNVRLNLERGCENKIEKEDLIKVLGGIETCIEVLLNDDSFIDKDSGYTFEFKGNYYFLNAKKYEIDKVITTLNSVRKIAAFCVRLSSSLIVKLGDETDNN